MFGPHVGPGVRGPESQGTSGQGTSGQGTSSGRPRGPTRERRGMQGTGAGAAGRERGASRVARRPRSALAAPRPAWLVLLAVLTALWAASPAAGQGETGGDDRSRLAGVVRDEAGTPLQGASVVLPELNRGALTGSDGRFRLTGLPPGRVTVRVEMLGRKTVAREVRLEPGAAASLELVLPPRPLESQEITVTGTPRATSPLEAVQEVDVVSTRQIQQSTTPALGDLLQQTVPGVSSIQTGAQGGKPVLRGLSGQRIRVLQNGIAQQYFQFGVRHFPPTSMKQAERVEVVRGASSVLYGSAALGGAVNVITRNLPSAPEGETRVGGRVRGMFDGNNEERTVGVDVRASRGDFGLRVGGERRVADDFSTPDVPTFFQTEEEGAPKYTGDIPFTNFDQWSGYAQAGVQAPFGTVQAFADHWRNDQNFLLPNGGPAGSRENPPVGLGQHLEHTNVALRSTLAADGFVVKPAFNYQRSLRQSAAPGDTIEGDPDFPIDLAKDVYTGRVELRHPRIGPLDGTWGAELEVQNTTSRGPVELEPSSDVVSVGGFAFEDLRLDPVTVSAGLRFDYREQEAAPNDRTADPELLRQTFSEVSGGVGVNWRVVEGVALASNFTSGFRAPSMFDLFSVGVEGGVAAFQRGNPGLDSERSLSVDVGLRARRGPVRGKLTMYRNEIRDFIFLERTGETHAPSGLPVFARGQTDATLRGLEGSVHVAANRWLEVGARGSALDTEGDDLVDPDTGDPGGGPLPLIPADRVGGHLQLSPSVSGPVRQPRLTLRVEHVSGKDAAGRIEPFSQFDDTPFGTASTDDYTLLGVEAHGTVDVGRQPLSVQVSVENLTNETYRSFLDTYKGYALSAGRSLTTSVTVPLGRGSGGS